MSFDISGATKMRLHIIAGLLSVFLFGLATGLLLSGSLVPTQPQLPLQQSDSGAPLLEALEAGTYTASIPIVSVTNTGAGMLHHAEVEIVDGKGRLLFNTNPFVEPDTQLSLETAKKVAQLYTDKNLEGKDAIYSINAENVQLVGGPSAGAAITIATISAIIQEPIREGIAITGTIEIDGSIGPVGGIPEKAIAAAEAGIKLFLVPEGQSKVVIYERKTQTQQGRGFTLRRTYYEPVEVDLNAEVFKEYGMEIREVKTIWEAAGLLFGK